MTKKELKASDRSHAIDTLKEWGLKDGSIVHAKVNHVSSSGMSRNIGLYLAQKNGVIINISFHAAVALGWKYKDGYTGGVVVSGCGQDMLFATVDALSWAMGFGSLCQNHAQNKAEVKKYGGNTIKAIGLKYRSL